MTLGTAIKEARLKAGMTQQDLARALAGVDSRLTRVYDKSVGSWERDEVPRLSFYVVLAIAEATAQPLEAFAIAVRESRLPLPALPAESADRAKLDQAAADLAARRPSEQRRGTDDPTR